MPNWNRRTIDDAASVRLSNRPGIRWGKLLGETAAVVLSLMVAMLSRTVAAQTAQVGDWPAPIRVIAEEQPSQLSESASASAVEVPDGGGSWLSFDDMDSQSLIDLRQSPWFRFGSPLSTEPEPQHGDSDASSSETGVAGYGVPTRDFGSAPMTDKPKATPTTNITVELQSDFAWFDQSAEKSSNGR